jgi:hypothetical protein
MDGALLQLAPVWVPSGGGNTPRAGNGEPLRPQQRNAATTIDGVATDKAAQPLRP